MNRISSASLVCLAGSVAVASTPQTAPNGMIASRQVAHLYVNAATGEVIATSLSESAARGVSGEVWIADNYAPCAKFGEPAGTAVVLDDPDAGTSAAIGATFLDWGDIPQDTVIDAVQIAWATQHQDTDTDGDGIGDGVPGFGATWSWYDGDNGFNTCFTRTPLVGFTLFDLPGVTGPVDPNLVAVYTATVDLASTFDTSISFEIGDSDGDPQSAAVHNAFFALGDLDSDTIPDGDLDGDGLADFAYALRFYQPGTTDFDGDTIPDGDPGNMAITAIRAVAPSGTTVFDGTSYTIDPIDPLPAGQGMEDVFDIYTDLNDDGLWEPLGTFWYGGFSCNPYVPFAQFEHALFGPTGEEPCLADLAPPEGVLNFFDVSAFLGAYNSQNPIADFAAPFGTFNFFDVSAFLSAYNAGCP